MRKQNLFTQNPVRNVKRNLFDLSHEVKMSGKFGLLMPVLCTEALPGDTFRDQMTAMVRFAPLLSPIMHRVDVKTDFFFVPHRIVCDHWESFITGGQDGSEVPVLPYTTPLALEATTHPLMSKCSLWDYLGLPILTETMGTTDSTQKIQLMAAKSYQKIFNDYFRDPNLDTEIELNTDEEGAIVDGTKLLEYWSIRRRGWEKDYFTAALPFAQRGPSVLMPFDAEVTYRDQSVARFSASGSPMTAGNWQVSGSVNEPGGVVASATTSPVYIDNIESVSSSNITINDLRRSIAIQGWLENNARGGARYNEQILSHFQTQVPDYRLQMAEYLGGGRQPVVISEVVATAEGATVPVGDMAGHGISVGKSNQFTYRCQEHGFIIGVLSVVPKTAYYQGIPKQFTREDKFDYAWPELANLGEQEILSKEIFFDFADSGMAANNTVFGYIPRYSEYKQMQDRVAGDFRQNLMFQHLARVFTARPTLNYIFQQMLENNTATEETYRRVFAVTDGNDYLWMQLFHRLSVKRALPYFGVPMLTN